MARYWDRSAHWLSRHGRSYWETLVEQEKSSGERYVGGRTGTVRACDAREAIAVVPQVARPPTSTTSTRPHSSRAHAILTWYEDEGLSAFTTLYGGPLGRDAGSPSSCGSSPAPPSSRITVPTTTTSTSNWAASSCSPPLRRWRRGCDRSSDDLVHPASACARREEHDESV